MKSKTFQRKYIRILFIPSIQCAKSANHKGKIDKCGNIKIKNPGTTRDLKQNEDMRRNFQTLLVEV